MVLDMEGFRGRSPPRRVTLNAQGLVRSDPAGKLFVVREEGWDNGGQDKVAGVPVLTFPKDHVEGIHGLISPSQVLGQLPLYHDLCVHTGH